MYTLEQARSGFLGDEYVKAAERVLQGAGFNTKHVGADKKLFYCSFGL